MSNMEHRGHRSRSLLGSCKTLPAFVAKVFIPFDSPAETKVISLTLTIMSSYPLGDSNHHVKLWSCDSMQHYLLSNLVYE